MRWYDPYPWAGWGWAAAVERERGNVRGASSFVCVCVFSVEFAAHRCCHRILDIRYPMTKPCDAEPLKSSKACDPSANVESRIADIIRQIPASGPGLENFPEIGNQCSWEIVAVRRVVWRGHS